MNNRIFEPRQWVYVIEKATNQVKVGVTTKISDRLEMIERTGGFHISRKRMFGPFQNGYQIESEIHRHICSQQIIGEWFSVSFEQAVSVASTVADSLGDTSVANAAAEPDYEELLDFLYPWPKEVWEVLGFLNDAGLGVYKEKNGSIWFESEGYGIFSLDFLKGYMDVVNHRQGGHQHEY
jgi:hypothetical protein